jgi:hypothetical protein
MSNYRNIFPDQEQFPQDHPHLLFAFFNSWVTITTVVPYLFLTFPSFDGSHW